MAALRHLRSALAVVLVLLVFIPGGIVQRMFVWPAARLFPRYRLAVVSAFMRAMSRSILGLLSAVGGARFLRQGRIVTTAPCLVLMNHQSLLDILSAVLLSHPYVPGFVTRRRYSRFVPVVSLCLRLLGCPIIDPENARRRALATIEEAARTLPQGLLIFPEGHRTRDGEIQAFKTAGALAFLRTRKVPVYVVVTDGVWAAPRLTDFVFGVQRLQGRTEVLGPFMPPDDHGQNAAFLAGLREKMVEHLREMRGRP